MAPRREPSAAAPISTIIGWMVKGTGVNGSGKLSCAAAAVSTVTKTTDSACTPVQVFMDAARMLT